MNWRRKVAWSAPQNDACIWAKRSGSPPPAAGDRRGHRPGEERDAFLVTLLPTYQTPKHNREDAQDHELALHERHRADVDRLGDLRDLPITA